MDELIQDMLTNTKIESITFAYLEETSKFRCELTWVDGSVNRRSMKTPEGALRSVLRGQNLL